MTVDIQIGDCRALLAAMAPQSVHCCVTSPPYFGLRDYGHEGQMGLEPTPDEFVAGMVAVFREVKRVLRDDGTLWLNLGDSYAAGGKSKNLGRNDAGRDFTGGGGNLEGSGNPGKQGSILSSSGLAIKQLIGVPWRVAFALQADGWYLRQDIIWHKPNPMPESVRDRCTKAHEYIFLFSKSPRYHFDADAIKEPSVQDPRLFGKGGAKDTRGEQGYSGASGAQRDNSGGYGTTGNRNRRSVWTVSTKPFKGAHFATFPPDLIEPCILAGCPVCGTVLDPFGGAGTTGLVAQAHGRNAILCELNPEYAAMARERIDAPPVVKMAKKKPANDNRTVDLFGGTAA